MLEKISCIYRITNIVNSGFYIGSAINFHKRKNSHLSGLRRGIHKNSHLQRTFNKYGEDTFIFEILEKTEKNNLLILEQWYIDTYKPNFNICKKAESRIGLKNTEEHRNKIKISNTGKKVSEETKEKLRNINMGNIVSEETKEKLRNHSLCKKVYQFDINGNFISEYRSIREASRETKIGVKLIRMSAENKSKLAKSFIWKYENSITENEIKNRTNHSNKKRPIIQLDMFNNIINEFPSIQEAARTSNLNPRKICSCCKLKLEKYNDYKWIYKDT